jgi:hypothetical protein
MPGSWAPLCRGTPPAPIENGVFKRAPEIARRTDCRGFVVGYSAAAADIAAAARVLVRGLNLLAN